MLDVSATKAKKVAKRIAEMEQQKLIALTYHPTRYNHLPPLFCPKQEVFLYFPSDPLCFLDEDVPVPFLTITREDVVVAFGCVTRRNWMFQLYKLVRNEPMDFFALSDISTMVLEQCANATTEAAASQWKQYKDWFEFVSCGPKDDVMYNAKNKQHVLLLETARSFV